MKLYWKLLAAVISILLAGCASGPSIPEGQLTADQIREGVQPPQEEVWIEPLSEQQLSRFREARSAWADKDLERARQLLESLLAQRPDHPDLLTNAGLIAREQGQADEARDLLEEALKRRPGHRVASNNLALLLKDQGEFVDARRVLRRALQRHPDDPMLHYNLAIIYELYLQNLESALEHYRQYRQLAPEPDPQVEGWIADLERRIRQ